MQWSKVELGDAVPTPRSRFSAVSIRNGTNFVVFGGSRAGRYLNDVYVLNTGFFEWSKPNITGTPPIARDSHSAVSIDCRMYIFGGSYGHNKCLNDLYIFDAEEKLRWVKPTVTGNRPSARESHSATIVGNKMYVFGGRENDVYYNDLYVLDLTTHEWTKPFSSGNPPSARACHSACLIGNSIYVFGGSHFGKYLDDVHCLDTDTLTWSEPAVSGALPCAREGHSATAKGNKMYVFGGRGRYEYLNDLFVFDIESMQWSEPPVSPPLIAARCGHQATFIGAKFLVFGGWGRYEYLNDLEVLETSMGVVEVGEKVGTGKAMGTQTSYGDTVKDDDAWKKSTNTQTSHVEFLSNTNMEVSNFITNRFEADTRMLIGEVFGKKAELLYTKDSHSLTMRLREEEAKYETYTRGVSLMTNEDVNGKLTSFTELCRVEDRVANEKQAQDLEALIPYRERLRNESRTEVQSVVDQLHRISFLHQERINYLVSLIPQLEIAVDGKGHPPTKEQIRVDLDFTLKRYEEWQQKMRYALGPAMAQTDTALKMLYEALIEEKKLLDENQELIDQGVNLSNDLFTAAKQEVSNLKGDNAVEKHLNTTTLHRVYGRVVRELENVDAEAEEIKAMQQEIKELGRMKSKQNLKLIELNAELQRLKLAGSPQDIVAQQIDQIELLQAQTHDVIQREFELSRRVRELAAVNHPEYKVLDPVSFNAEAPSIYVDRKAGEYKKVRLLSHVPHKVFQTNYHGRLCVLKEVVVSDANSRRAFENDIAVLQRLRHPCIVQLEAIFFEDFMAFIQMPFYEGGTARDWLSVTRSQQDIKKVFWKVAHGLCYLHDHGMTHKDLDLDNVLLLDSSGHNPVISDFGISSDYPTGKTTAPEVVLGGEATTLSDVWQFGAMVYEAIFKEKPKLDAENVRIPRSDVEDLKTFLQCCLQRDPARRVPIRELLHHPFFFKMAPGFSNSFERKEFVKLQSRLHDIRVDELRGDVHWVVTKGRETESVLQHFKDATIKDMTQRLFLVYGEGGAQIDDLNPFDMTAKILNIVFEDLVSPERDLFFSPTAPDVTFRSRLYLPGKSHEVLEDYEAIGKLIAKCIVDGIPVKTHFAPSLYKYLLNKEPSFRDLDAFDPSRALEHRRMLIAYDVEKLNLNFGELVKNGRDVTVTEGNKYEFVNKSLKHHLVSARLPQLMAIKKGFSQLDLANHLPNIDAVELAILCEHGHIDSDMVKNNIKFIGFPSNSPAVNHFVQFVEESSPQYLHRLLYLATGHTLLPDGGYTRKITIHACPGNIEQMPEGHVAAHMIDLPDLHDFDVLRDKLIVRLLNVDAQVDDVIARKAAQPPPAATHDVDENGTANGGN